MAKILTIPMIINGDCLTVMRGMDAKSVDAIVTDPPYGLEFMGKEWIVCPGTDSISWRAGRHAKEHRA